MRTLLLIDHNKDNLQFMKEALVSIDDEIQCLSFVFAEEVIAACANETLEVPTAIFMNFDMPTKDGAKFLQELRAYDQYHELPVIFYVSKVTLEIVKLVENLGVTMTFEKPNTIRGWKTVMREMVSSIGNAAPGTGVVLSRSGSTLIYTE
jgi:response regulator RpfG family c-di-GMP phosphodiesterase